MNNKATHSNTGRETRVSASSEDLDSSWDVKVGQASLDQGLSCHSCQHICRVHKQHGLLVKKRHYVLKQTLSVTRFWQDILMIICFLLINLCNLRVTNMHVYTDLQPIISAKRPEFMTHTHM